tara:strand:+ start:27 stop:929 length:903 start_codon:yes stop_codon:yes gene_type:complete
MFEKVLVLGGTGFLGSRMKLHKPEWTYVGSKDCNLIDSKECYELFSDIKPDAIIHLAGRVGGIKDNAQRQAEFFYDNVMINTNVIHQAYKTNIPRVLCALSTCCYPNEVQKYPLTEDDILNGPPAPTNLSYGFAKRVLYIQTKSYRSQYGLNYSCFCPSNIYGPQDNFYNDKSHFVAAMIRKIYNAPQKGSVEFWGTGRPRRQQLYVDDLVRIIPTLLERHNSDCPVIVAPSENLTIKEMIDVCVKASGKEIMPIFNGKLDGQYRKDGDNKNLLKLLGNFNFTKFKNGLRETYEWYAEQQ